MLAVIIQYLLSPIVFPLTFILPVVSYFINRRYVWFSILLTVIVEVIINWGIAVMAILILILKAVVPKIKR